MGLEPQCCLLSKCSHEADQVAEAALCIISCLSLECGEMPGEWMGPSPRRRRISSQFLPSVGLQWSIHTPQDSELEGTGASSVTAHMTEQVLRGWGAGRSRHGDGVVARAWA